MKKILLALGVYLLPVVAFAQNLNTRITGLGDIFRIINDIIKIAVPLVIGLAVLVFLWGVLRYVITTDEDKKKEGKSLMLWGIVGIFVMVSIWGLVGILQNTFGINDSTPPPTPELPRVN